MIAIDSAIAEGELEGAEALMPSGVHRPGQRRHFQLAHAMRARAALDAAVASIPWRMRARAPSACFRQIDYPFWTAVTMCEHAAGCATSSGTDAAPFVAMRA